jgi:hypothetical protein
MQVFDPRTALWVTALCLGASPLLAGQVDMDRIDDKTFSGIVRCMKNCDPQDAVDLGMKVTGSEPVFDDRHSCRHIDEAWAIDYGAKRSRAALHGGIDIPAPRGTPILAVADGSVVAMFDNHETAVGVRVFLQHAPEQTGKPFWAYSEYAHLQELPPLAIGQPVRRGGEVGKTGNTGISGAEARARAGDFNARTRARRDAVHFSIMYSDTPDYAIFKKNGGYLIPVGGRWMDPVAFYRAAPPYDSDALLPLPEAEKRPSVPFQTETGEVVPSASKLVWPYACNPR